MATHSSVLAWRIPGTGEPGGLPSMGSHRVGYDWSDLTATAWAVGVSVFLALAHRKDSLTNCSINKMLLLCFSRKKYKNYLLMWVLKTHIPSFCLRGRRRLWTSLKWNNLKRCKQKRRISKLSLKQLQPVSHHILKHTCRHPQGYNPVFRPLPNISYSRSLPPALNYTRCKH